MSVQTFDNHSSRGAVVSILSALGNVFTGIFAAREAHARFNELWYLSDSQLAERGLRREDIAGEVMRIFDAN